MNFAPFLFVTRGIDQKDMIQMARLHDAHDIVRGWGPPAVGTTECATLALSSVLHDWIVLLAVLLLLLFFFFNDTIFFPPQTRATCCMCGTIYNHEQRVCLNESLTHANCFVFYLRDGSIKALN